MDGECTSWLSSKISSAENILLKIISCIISRWENIVVPSDAQKDELQISIRASSIISDAENILVSSRISDAENIRCNHRAFRF